MWRTRRRTRYWTTSSAVTNSSSSGTVSSTTTRRRSGNNGTIRRRHDGTIGCRNNGTIGRCRRVCTAPSTRSRRNSSGIRRRRRSSNGKFAIRTTDTAHAAMLLLTIIVIVVKAGMPQHFFGIHNGRGRTIARQQERWKRRLGNNWSCCSACCCCWGRCLFLAGNSRDGITAPTPSHHGVATIASAIVAIATTMAMTMTSSGKESGLMQKGLAKQSFSFLFEIHGCNHGSGFDDGRHHGIGGRSAIGRPRCHCGRQRRRRRNGSLVVKIVVIGVVDNGSCRHGCWILVVVTSSSGTSRAANRSTGWHANGNSFAQGLCRGFINGSWNLRCLWQPINGRI